MTLTTNGKKINKFCNITQNQKKAQPSPIIFPGSEKRINLMVAKVNCRQLSPRKQRIKS